VPYKSAEDRRRASRRHYAAHKADYLTRARANNILQIELIKQLLRSAKEVPCTDCKVAYPYYVMQFDHRQGVIKRFTIGAIGSRAAYSLATIRKEIAKCDVVCANCHAERTWQRAQRTAALVAGVRFELTTSGL
jgi:hypothetical protein